MYINKVHINNIRSISHFEMTFDKPAGWHVLIGDNGAGKTTIMRSISLALIDVEQIPAARQSFDDWLNKSESIGEIKIELYRDKKYDGEKEQAHLLDKLHSHLRFVRYSEGTMENANRVVEAKPNSVMFLYHLGNGTEEIYKYWGNNGWFSVGYGPFRRFAGGNPENEKLFKSYPQLGAHLSMFGEDVALTEILKWLKDLDYLRLKEKESKNGEDNTIVYENLIKFINKSELLPHKVTIEDIDTEGIIFKDGNGNRIPIVQLSDGYRSILSLTFELIRQLVRVYGGKQVFQDIRKGEMQIPLPGVVLIDEIDAHLHPTWQTHIGQWFTKYFPNIQFIVTTHSPLVCRACDKGSIWGLAAPGSTHESGEITGLQKERLIFGNILDAYGTEVFGSEPVRSKQSDDKLSKLGKLNIKFALGKTTTLEETERLKLQQILSTDAPTGF
jgi:AAA15 family ATPase/GTPase